MFDFLFKKRTLKPQSTKTLNNDNLRHAVQKKAYELFIKRGKVHGHDKEDWIEAERLMQFNHKEEKYASINR